MNAITIVQNTVGILNFDLELNVLKDEKRKAYYGAFQAFDWNINGKTSYGSLIFIMRRAGLNSEPYRGGGS
jgi:Ca2+-binding EF-hand superfamily protein